MRVLRGFHDGVVQHSVLLGYDTASLDNQILTFGGNIELF
jgi:hypothetical protein